MGSIDNLSSNEKWAGLHKAEASRERLENDKRGLLSACANCEDFGKVVEQKDGWCINCEIFRALSYVKSEIAKL